MPLNQPCFCSAQLSFVASLAGAPITRLREECSSRPLLFHFIIKLLFLTLCFLLRRLSGVWNSLSCCLLTQKGSSSRSSCLCEGAALNHIRIDIFSRLLEMTPSSSFSNANNHHHHHHLQYHCFFVFFVFLMWLTVMVTPGKRGSESEGVTAWISCCSLLALRRCSLADFLGKRYRLPMLEKVFLCSRTHVFIIVLSYILSFYCYFFVSSHWENQNFTFLEIHVVFSAPVNSRFYTLLFLQVKQRKPTCLTMPPSFPSHWSPPRLCAAASFLDSMRHWAGVSRRRCCWEPGGLAVYACVWKAAMDDFTTRTYGTSGLDNRPLFGETSARVGAAGRLTESFNDINNRNLTQ